MATCLYKPKPCASCGVVIQVGEDCEYLSETKAVRHWACSRESENQPPSADAYALADRLGFIEFSQDMAVVGLLDRMRPRQKWAQEHAGLAQTAMG